MKHPDLFPEMQMSAAFSGPDNCYRDELRRVWNAAWAMLPVCMLNPSTADHERNDPTLLALIHFGKRWGYGGLLVVNLFAFRSPSPAAMRAADNPFGPNNAAALAAALIYAKGNGRRLLAAWGTGGTHEGRADWFMGCALQVGVDLICLGMTEGGHPKHPLARGKHFIPRDQQPIMLQCGARSEAHG